jgi:hypothetical protein
MNAAIIKIKPIISLNGLPLSFPSSSIQIPATNKPIATNIINVLKNDKLPKIIQKEKRTVFHIFRIDYSYKLNL